MNESRNNKVESSRRQVDNTNVESKVKHKGKECKNCFEKIHIAAKVCKHCGRAQGFWRRHFGDTAIIVSIVMLIIAATQLVGAFKKNVDASKALNTAKNAALNANLALTQAQTDANEIKNLKSEADKLNRLLEKFSKLTSEIVEIQRISVLINEFMMTVINAQNGYRKALDQLHKWSNDDSFLLNHQAWQAWKDIAKKYNPYLNNKIGTPLPWKEGTDPSTLTFIDLKRNYQGQDSLSDYKPALINYIWMRNDISEGERMEFLVEIIKSDDSLKAVNVAGQLFWKAAKLKSRIFSSEEDLSKWWEENKGNYNKNPEDQPTDSPDKK